MKKIALILSLVLLMGAMTACGSAPAETTAPQSAVTAPEGTTEELMNKLYENVTVELPLMTMPIDLADEFAVAAYTGAESAEGIVEGSFSESMIGAQAYSVSLVRCESAEAAEALAKTMFEKIDTRKWVCVEATEKQAVVCGDLVLFVMLNSEYGVSTDAIVEAFTTVCGGTVGTILK
ncbi:MAG: hypothetical protein E7451_06485 [Ruminococcaceae bacterium]|nr:hypothetical protein [Oscillospiraceae bacterium]